VTPEVYKALQDVRGAAIDFLSRDITDLAPVLEINQMRPMPAAYWANRLYNDAGRIEELTQRNSVKHPLFMPLEFEAVSR
jgi:prophage DNA circulation protein